MEANRPNEVTTINKEGIKEVASKIKGSLFVKIITIIVLILILMIPTTMVKSLVSERSNRKESAIKEISSKWGGSQILSGPILTVPYKHHQVSYSYNGKTQVKDVYTETKTATFLPEEFVVNSQLDPEMRYRGIYQALLYTANVSMSGHFSYPDFSSWNINDEDILWDDAYISLGITDLSGIRESVKLTFSDKNCEVESGTDKTVVVKSGVHAKVAMKRDEKKLDIPFVVSMVLNGSSEFNVTPIGKSSVINMESKWNSPSFVGSILPVTREISADGFSAKWNITHLNRSIPQQWLVDEDFFSQNNSGSYNYDVYSNQSTNANIGVNMVLPVDDYHKIKRTVDYAILFTLLTFVMFFVFELIFKVKVHPFQYLLIGAALTLFYSLLLSLTEQTQFITAYLTASIATTLMIGLYTKSIVKKLSLSFTVGAFISVLYLYLYTVLQMEQLSLLIGSIGLFAMLGAVMYLTRNINWYEEK